MTWNISDLMDGLGDETLELADAAITTPDRILELVRERSGQITHTKSRKPRKLGRVLALAAALTMLLSVTAYAVYQLTMADRELMVYTDSDGSAVHIYSAITESREFQAAQEYAAYRYSSHEEDYDVLLDRDDPRHMAYDIGWESMAKKTEAIAEKYGLRMWESTARVNSLEALYSLLETEPFFRWGDFETGVEMHDDGSFHMTCVNAQTNGREILCYVTCSAKGALGTWEFWGGAPDSYTYETYVSASGVPVDIALSQDAETALLFAELDGCYVSMEFFDHDLNGNTQPLTMDELKTLVDGVAFDILNERMDGRPMGEEYKAAADAYAAKIAADAALEAEYQAQYRDNTQKALSVLGEYTIAALPEGFEEDARFTFGQQLSGSGTTDLIYDTYHRSYTQNTETAESLYSLSYTRCYTSEERTETDNRAYLEETADWFVSYFSDYEEVDVEIVPCQVNGWDGFYISAFNNLYWFDEARDMVFCVGAAIPMDVTQEELTALAESVTEAK